MLKIYLARCTNKIPRQPYPKCPVLTPGVPFPWTGLGRPQDEANCGKATGASARRPPSLLCPLGLHSPHGKKGRGAELVPALGLQAAMARRSLGEEDEPTAPWPL